MESEVQSDAHSQAGPEPTFPPCTAPLGPPPLLPQGLCPMLTWGPSFRGSWTEGGWAALGRQGLPKPTGVAAWWGQGPICHVRAGHSGNCWLRAERTGLAEECGNEGIKSKTENPNEFSRQPPPSVSPHYSSLWPNATWLGEPVSASVAP